MPLGFERLNERQQRPNANINFIKPLQGQDSATAQEFLQRIAAQCYPVMKKHYISVMALEEYPPNPEFLGRNFNAGEVIQLVLKDKAGRWLSFRFVQMVMMHELAHCKQMNHSRFFWSVRNEYAKQMEGLWQDNYTGEGMWGRGRGLSSGTFIHERPPDESSIPEHLCGGSYRRRGKKRRRGSQVDTIEKVSYAERQQRRIAKKFGKHGDGESVGEDELLRGALETMTGGKRGTGKPRVANSKRGRELRANAALARFSQAKAQPEIKLEPEDDIGSESDSDWDEDSPPAAGEVAIKDRQGRDLVKVCGDEDEEDETGAGQEMAELRRLGHGKVTKQNAQKPQHVQDNSESGSDSGAEVLQATQQLQAIAHNEAQKPSAHVARSKCGMEQDTSLPSGKNSHSCISPANKHGIDNRALHRTLVHPEPEVNLLTTTMQSAATSSSGSDACPICSLDNVDDSSTCVACAHVLRPCLIPNSWRCPSEACKGSQYVNAADAGRCGLCGSCKPVSSSRKLGSEKFEAPPGFTRAEVLRWD